MAEPPPNGFRMHRTGQQISDLLKYGHIIPISKGYTKNYVAEKFPGWNWNELMAVWRAAGIVVGGAGGMPTCDARVESVSFNGPDDLAVQWTDGSTTRRTPRSDPDPA